MGTPLYLLHAVTTAAISPFPHSAAVSTPFHPLILPRRVTAAFAPHCSTLPSFPSFFPFVQALLSSVSTAVRSVQHFPLPHSFGSKSKSSAGLEIEFEIEPRRKDTSETEGDGGRKETNGLEEGKGGSAGERRGTNGSKKNRKGEGTGMGSAEQSRCASGGGTGVVWWVDGRTPYKN